MYQRSHIDKAVPDGVIPLVVVQNIEEQAPKIKTQPKKEHKGLISGRIRERKNWDTDKRRGKAKRNHALL